MKLIERLTPQVELNIVEGKWDQEPSSDWKPFLSNDKNKDEFFKFLPEEPDTKFCHFS